MIVFIDFHQFGSVIVSLPKTPFGGTQNHIILGDTYLTMDPEDAADFCCVDFGGCVFLTVTRTHTSEMLC